MADAYNRFRARRDDGAFAKLLGALHLRLNEEGRIDYESWCADSSVIRAHFTTAGAGKRGEEEPGRRPCMDKTFEQLIRQTRGPLPIRPGSVQRFDHVYTRNGAASLFVAFEPLAGWRTVAVTDHCRRLEWAVFVRSLLDGRYHEAEKVVMVMDQLNTHSAASFNEAFPPPEARRLAERLEIHHTPKHGSWLNMAEIALSVMGRQCLSRRIARRDTLADQVEQWADDRNVSGQCADWQFTTADARVKLRQLYPSIEDG
jgi:hypothetical protein